MKNKSNKKQPVPDRPETKNPPVPKVSLLLQMKHLRAMNILASTDGIRYPFSGVHLTYDGKHLLLVATDGRKMGILNISDAIPASDDSHQPFSYTIQSQTILDACRLFPNKNLSVWVEFDDQQGVSFSAFGKTMRNKVIDGNYLEWKQVVPKSKPAPADNVNLNGEYLNHFTQVAKLIARNPCLYIRGHNDIGEGSAEQCGFTVRFCDDFFLGIIMPLRATEEHIVNGQLPVWLQ